MIEDGQVSSDNQVHSKLRNYCLIWNLSGNGNFDCKNWVITQPKWFKFKDLDFVAIIDSYKLRPEFLFYFWINFEWNFEVNFFASSKETNMNESNLKTDSPLCLPIGITTRRAGHSFFNYIPALIKQTSIVSRWYVDFARISVQ